MGQKILKQGKSWILPATSILLEHYVEKTVIAYTAVLTTLPGWTWEGLSSLHSFIYLSKYNLWLMCLEKIQSHQVEYLALL